MISVDVRVSGALVCLADLLEFRGSKFFQRVVRPALFVVRDEQGATADEFLACQDELAVAAVHFGADFLLREHVGILGRIALRETFFDQMLDGIVQLFRSFCVSHDI